MPVEPTVQEAKPRPGRRWWRLLRVYFRRFRLGVWLIVLLLVGAMVYLDQVGLPDFAKRPLLQNLRARGIDLEFDRLRLHWHQGIVAEGVRFGSAAQGSKPSLRAADVQVGIEPASLLRLRPQIESLTIRRGVFTWPVVETNREPRRLEVTGIRTDVRFLTNDTWVLDNMQATFLGAHLRLTGYLTNASAIRQWEWWQPRQKTPAGEVGSRLKQLADTLEAIKFEGTPELNLNVEGDASSVQSFSVRLLVSALGADTPWGQFNDAKLNLRLLPATNDVSMAHLRLEAMDARTRWANVTNLDLTLGLEASSHITNLVNAKVELAAGDAVTQWAQAHRIQLSGHWVHCLTNPVPVSGEGEIQCGQAVTKWASASGLTLQAQFLAPQKETLPAFDPSWAGWTNIQPYAVAWRASADGLQAQGVDGRRISLDGSWRAPDLVISNASLRISERDLKFNGRLNVASRYTALHAESAIDPARVMTVLTPGARKWLGQFTWNQPPEAAASVSLTLPAWTNRQPDWRGEVQPTLVLDGQFHVGGGGTYRGVEVSAARSHFTYSNMNWNLPDLLIERPEGRALAEHREDDRTKNFYWKVVSTLDPRALRPLLKTNDQRGVDLVSFGQPPMVNLEAWGRSHAPETVRVRADVAATNVTFHGQTASTVHALVLYTNKYLQVIDPIVWRGPEYLSADGITADFWTETVHITNAVGKTDPMFVARAIGPQTARAIEDYRFGGPVEAKVNGRVHMHQEELSDLRFQLNGGPFEWWRFNIPQISGQVHWEGTRLKLSDIKARFYGGAAEGFANFDLSEPHATKYSFVASATNVLLPFLVKDLFPDSKGLEGNLNATLVITHANSAVTNDIQGYGKAELRDGLIWDIPMFGVFSPILNAVTPGLGNSRATYANCTFSLTNAVAHTPDLLIRSQGFRLKYAGMVDLEGRTDARAEAELLRDMWIVGPLVSSVLWPVTKMFEYKVSGTVGNPQLEPVYIFPKIMALPFAPFKTLRGLFPGSPSEGQSNAPPVFQEYYPESPK